VVGVFKRLFNASDEATLRVSTNVKQIRHTWACFEIQTNEWIFEHDKVVITTWWQAFAHTGSTGDGYAFARACGHTITPLGPSLNSFVTYEQRHTELSGTVFEQASIVHKDQQASWPVLLTHFGLSGPGMFMVASQIPFVTISQTDPHPVRLIPIVSQGYEQRIDWLRTKRSTDPKQSVRIWLTQFFTKRTCEIVCKTFGRNESTFSTLTKEQTKHIADTLWNWFHFSLIKRRPWDEFVTAWGVVTAEVDPKTMQSRLMPWLYFAGEVLDVDGVTWGYNLQASWATGRMAGKAIVKWLNS
jgi:hypothetical protein